jgi:hypothetical protein
VRQREKLGKFEEVGNRNGKGKMLEGDDGGATEKSSRTKIIFSANQLVRSGLMIALM